MAHSIPVGTLQIQETRLIPLEEVEGAILIGGRYKVYDEGINDFAQLDEVSSTSKAENIGLHALVEQLPSMASRRVMKDCDAGGFGEIRQISFQPLEEAKAEFEEAKAFRTLDRFFGLVVQALKIALVGAAILAVANPVGVVAFLASIGLASIGGVAITAAAVKMAATLFLVAGAVKTVVYNMIYKKEGFLTGLCGIIGSSYFANKWYRLEDAEKNLEARSQEIRPFLDYLSDSVALKRTADNIAFHMATLRAVMRKAGGKTEENQAELKAAQTAHQELTEAMAFLKNKTLSIITAPSHLEDVEGVADGEDGVVEEVRDVEHENDGGGEVEGAVHELASGDDVAAPPVRSRQPKSRRARREPPAPLQAKVFDLDGLD